MGYQQRQRDDVGAYYENSDTNYSEASAFNTQVKHRLESYECGASISNNRKIEWVLDSSCSDHIINNESYYDECVNLKTPVNVKIGDGKVIKATKVGNVKHFFVINNQRKLNIGKNVFFVEKMDKNLLSFGKITVANRIVSEGNTS